MKTKPNHSTTDTMKGLVVAHHGVAVEVLLGSGERRKVRVKRSSGHVVGDNVTVDGEVLQRLPRKSELRRRDAGGGIHLVAANLDVLGIVVAPLPIMTAGFIDRAIVAARAADLHPFIVVNKCDLDNSADMVTTLRETYSETVPLFALSAATGNGLSELRSYLASGHRGAFVGTSGVGKSSLLNTLCPSIDLRVGELNDYNSRGCNTTTVSTLHSLDGGGELVDTPGFLDFGLVDISAEELAIHFTGFEKGADTSCRFRNCRHRTEPGCAVIKLTEEGEISMDRYTTYLDILGEVERHCEEARRKCWGK